MMGRGHKTTSGVFLSISNSCRANRARGISLVWLLAFTKSFAWLVYRVVGLFTPREKPLITLSTLKNWKKKGLRTFLYISKNGSYLVCKFKTGLWVIVLFLRKVFCLVYNIIHSVAGVKVLKRRSYSGAREDALLSLFTSLCAPGVD